MRALLLIASLALCLAGAVSASAGPARETFSLVHVSPGRVKDLLMSTWPARPGAAASVTEPVWARIQGLTGLSTDETRRSVTVFGTPEGIAEFRKVLRLIDVPAPRAVLEVVLFDDLARLRAAAGVPPVPEQGSVKVAVEVRDEEARALQAAPGARTLLQASGSSEETLLIRADLPGRGPLVLELTPRINGDGTVTLVPARLPVGRGLTGSAEFVRRLEPGHSMLLVCPDERVALWIRVLRE